MFFLMLRFWFSRLSRGWMGKKWPRILKIFVCCTLYFRNHISYDLHLWYTGIYKEILSPGIIRGEGKRAKNGPKWHKILSVSLCISGTIHHMTVIFGAHVQNDICTKFFHFSKFWFLGFLGGWRAKSDLKLPISVCLALYLRN